MRRTNGRERIEKEGQQVLKGNEKGRGESWSFERRELRRNGNTWATKRKTKIRTHGCGWEFERQERKRNGTVRKCRGVMEGRKEGERERV